MWSRLGVAAGDDDPVVKELITLVDDLLRRVHQDMTRDRRVEYVASAEPDHDVLEQVELGHALGIALR